MRRMNYDRFAKPFNFGEYDAENVKFLLDKDIEDGFYMGYVNDEANGEISPFILKVDKKLEYYSSSVFYEANGGNIILLEANKFELNKIVPQDADGNPVNFPDGTTIYLYKLD